ncbi:MAG: hypothetical protein MI974_20905 [Chitinophagales bacterium]|nr:hypothetical protein [Chitinophagales bacterium]
MLNKNITVALCSLFLLANCTFTSAQGGIFMMPKSALYEFAPSVYFGPDADTIHTWVNKHGGKPMDKDWVPSQSETRYVAYKVRLLEYWFGPYQDKGSQQNALDKLYRLTNNSALQSKKNFIFVFPVFLIPGKKIGQGKLALLRDGTPIVVTPVETKKIEKNIDEIIENLKQVHATELPAEIDLSIKDIEKLQEAMNKTALTDGQKAKFDKLKGKYSKGGKDGASGPFPASYAFSKWFATVVEVLSEYLLPAELKRIAEKVITLSYMVIPEVMDRIASTLAKMQDAMVPDSVEDALDKATDVIRYAYQLYQDLKQVYDLVTDPDFQELLNDMDLTEAVSHFEEYANKYGLSIADNVIDRINKHFPMGGCFSINNITKAEYSSQFEECFKESAKAAIIYQAERLLKKTDIPVVRNLDIKALQQLANGETSFNEFAKTQAKKAGCSELGRYGYADACEQFIDGAPQKAATSAIAQQIEDRTGLSKAHIQGLVEALENGDHKKAMKHATSLPYEKYKHHFGDYAPIVKTIIDHPELSGLDNASLPAIGNYIERTLNSSAFKDAAISSISNLIGSKTGLSSSHINGFLASLEQEDYEQAIVHAGSIPEKYYPKHFGRYSDVVKTLVQNPNQKGLESSALKALDTYMESLLSDPMVRYAVKGTAMVMTEALKGEELKLKERLGMILKDTYGWDMQAVEAFLDGNYKLSTENILEQIAKKTGITNAKAIEALKKGDIEKALDYQIEFLKTQPIDTKQRIEQLKQQFKNKKEMLSIHAEVLKKNLYSSPQRTQELVYKNLFNQN